MGQLQSLRRTQRPSIWLLFQMLEFCRRRENQPGDPSHVGHQKSDQRMVCVRDAQLNAQCRGTLKCTEFYSEHVLDLRLDLPSRPASHFISFEAKAALGCLGSPVISSDGGGHCMSRETIAYIIREKK